MGSNNRYSEKRGEKNVFTTVDFYNNENNKNRWKKIMNAIFVGKFATGVKAKSMRRYIKIACYIHLEMKSYHLC